MNDKLKYYQELFGLTNWKINTSVQPTLNATARTLANPNYYVADMVFKEEDPSDETILHEVIHVLFALYDFYADNLIPQDAQAYVFTARESSVSQLVSIIMRLKNRGNTGNVES